MLSRADARGGAAGGSTEVGVVVTGLGVVAPGACGVHEFRNLLREGRSAVSRDPDLISRSFGCHVSARGKLTQAALDRTFSELEQRRLLNTGHRYSIVAGVEAFADSGLSVAEDQPNTRWSIVFGVGLPGIDTLGDAIHEIDAGRTKRLGSTAIEMQMPSSATAILAARLGAGGQATSVASACASGTEAVYMGLDRIRRGLCDVVLVGSTEADGPHIWGAFDSLRVLTRASNDHPVAASRPLSARASGFVPASGAGALLLESKTHAERRGAKIYCELLGGHVNCGARRNGGTMTAPNPLAMRQCIREALSHARIDAAQVDLVSGHLTATAGDPNEVSAWSDALERKGRNFPLINAPKSLFGHALSASGSIELVACALQLDDAFAHPSINCEDLHPKIAALIDPQCVVRELRPGPIDTIAKACFGFGDVNACIVLRKAN